jgi:hypothetical protein
VEADAGFWFAVGRVLVAVAALCALGWALQRQRRESAQQLDRLLASQQQAQAHIQALSDKVAALATLVAAIPARVERPVEAPPPPQHRPRRESNPVRSYETARRLARSGASVEEIVATCGVAGTEARLLQRLLGAESQRESAA